MATDRSSSSSGSGSADGGRAAGGDKTDGANVVQRRTFGRWTLAAVGGAAAAAGTAAWWLQEQMAPSQLPSAGGAAVAGAASKSTPNGSATATATATAGPASGTGAASAAEAAFWQSRFIRPDGTMLELAALRGAPVVVNFWATWCPPCLQEMPEIDRFARAFAARGVRVVGLAIDNPSAVRSYLVRTPVSYDIGLAGFDGSELTRQLGNAAGGLPFSVVFDRAGRVHQRRIGVTNHDELARWVSAL